MESLNLKKPGKITFDVMISCFLFLTMSSHRFVDCSVVSSVWVHSVYFRLVLTVLWSLLDHLSLFEKQFSTLGLVGYSWVCFFSGSRFVNVEDLYS